MNAGVKVKSARRLGLTIAGSAEQIMKPAAVLFAMMACSLTAGTLVRGKIVDAAGRPASGTVSVAPITPFTAVDGTRVEQITLTVELEQGFLSIMLEPNDTSIPPSGYNVTYRLSNGARRTVTWIVPTSAAPVQVQDVEIDASQLPDGLCLMTFGGKVVAAPCPPGSGGTVPSVVGKTWSQLTFLTWSQLDNVTWSQLQ